MTCNYSSEELDQVFDSLSHKYRRRLISELAAEDTVKIKLQTLDSNHCIDWQAEMYHRHLPKLETNDIISWNRDSSTIKRGKKFDIAKSVLNLIHEKFD